jgi:hypothetical protein
MMQNIKDFDQAQDLVTMSIEPQYLRLFEAGPDQIMSAEQFGKNLAKYSRRLDANEMQAFQKFLMDAKKAGKIGSDSELFVRNGLRNFDKLKESKFAVTEVEKLKLNTSLFQKQVTAMKDNFKKSADALRKVKNRSPYPQQVEEAAQ